MAFALLLVTITAALGYFAHRARIRSLESILTHQTADEMRKLASRREEADRREKEIAALDRARCRVLVGMMNDLRTPLMMLKSPMQTSRQLGGTVDLDDDDLERMLKHADRIQRSIEQMEEVLKSELGSAELTYQTSDFVTTMERLVMSLRPLAERKGVTVQFRSDLDSLSFAFDAARIGQAVHGLIERALAAMASGDMLEFVLTLDEAPSHVTSPSHARSTSRGESFTSESGRVVLEIVDNGSSIDERYLKLLGSQVDWASFEDAVADATALSIALANRFVALHGGKLEIQPKAERGTHVRIALPRRIDIDRTEPDERDRTIEQVYERGTSYERDERGTPYETVPEEAVDPVLKDEAGHPEADGAEERKTTEKQTTVLVVDDHPGTRGYLAYALRRHHNVIEAANGREALDLIKETDPDLVISDIMMPVMDGTELCRSIKSDDALNHIPIFLVTANAIPTVKMESLESGADDYLVKPFDLDEAVMRINNEIRTRAELRKRYTREVVIRPSDITVTSADEAFLNKAREIIEENIDEGNFGVQDLASQLGLSPRQLQRRLRETVDQSPVEFIRTLRLQRAAQLLEAQYGNVSEVAYSVGFTSLSYFAKCFREHFGSTPSEFKSEQAA